MIIEENTVYSYRLKAIEKPNFDAIRNLAMDFVSTLPQKLVDKIYYQLKHGLNLLQYEPQMLVYLFSYGNMHEAKLHYAFNILPDIFLQLPEINIIDYGCGQATGTMCYADYIREKRLFQNIGTVTLIDPSEICLRRAALHTQAFFPDAKIRTICKDFDDLEDDDILCDEFTPTLHILSNVLDISTFDLEHFAKLIGKQLKGFNLFVCVGPFFNNSAKDKRMTKLIEFLNGDTLFAEKLRKNKLKWNKDWTCQTMICSVGNLKGFSSEEYKIDAIKKEIKDEFDVIYSRNGEKLIKCENADLECYKIKKGTIIICDNAFSNCHSLSKISFPNTVVSIGDYAFFGCGNLKQVSISESLKSIGVKSFSGCGALQCFYFPNSLINIGDESFFKCESLRQVYIPKLITNIGEKTFSGCKSLRKVTIPDTVTHIGNESFQGCESLETITIPKSVISIGERTFSQCKSLQEITILGRETGLGYDAFGDCESLQQIIIAEDSYEKYQKMLDKNLLDKLCYMSYKSNELLKFDKSKESDSDDSDVVCRVRLNEFEKGDFKCRRDIDGNYYLFLDSSFTGLEKDIIAYASDGSGRKPDYHNDSLIIYQYGEDFHAEFGIDYNLSKKFEDAPNFDFENAEIVCSVKLKDFEKSDFKCQQNANGDYYLLCLPSFTGLENPLVAYASNGSGRKPDFLNDSLIIYQNGDDFYAEYGIDYNESKEFEESPNFDFENAEIVCSVKLNDFEKSDFKCRQDANGDYYLLCLPSFTGLENPLVAYASDGSGRKPNFLNDSLIIYQNGDDFAAKFGIGNYEEIDD